MKQNTFSLVFIMHDRPDYPGGPIVNYRRLLPALACKGHTVSLICFYKKGYPNAEEIARFGITLYPFLHSDTKNSVSQILRVLQKVQPDVFIPDVSTPGCFAGKWVKKCGIPVITTMRSGDKTNWGRAVYFTNSAHDFQLSGLVCVSQYLHNKWLNQSASSHFPTAVIPSGVPLPSVYTRQESVTISICYAGRLVQKHKNISDVIQRMVNVCQHFPEILCTVIGDGPERDTCTRIVAKEKLIDRIRFTGSLYDADYTRMLAQHQVIVLLSDFEGIPGALMDGMACGLIPVVLRYPGVEELVVDMENGVIVENTEEHFLQAVKLLSESESLRCKLSSNAIKTISTRFSLDQSILKWENIISECIANSGKKRHFSLPQILMLPPYNPLLIEDKRKQRRGKISRILSFLDRITIPAFTR